MKIISKIHIHVFFYIVMAICLFTGNIRDFLIFSSIIIVHELGHITASLFFKWNIDRVVILPFGGLTIFNNKINTSLKEQFIVTIFGPLFQIIFYLVIIKFYYIPRINYYNFVLLVFNLLPIYPLDGSKLLYCFLCFLLPFKTSHLITLIVSTCFIVLIACFFKFNLILYLILIFLVIKVIKEFYMHKAIFNKFLFERYNYGLSFNKIKYVKKINSMSLWHRHIFLLDGKSTTEREMLSKRFDK